MDFFSSFEVQKMHTEKQKDLLKQSLQDRYRSLSREEAKKKRLATISLRKRVGRALIAIGIKMLRS